MIRRILYAFAGLLVLLSLGIILFKVYRQQQSYAVAVPRDAASVIRVHVDQLATDIIWNMLRHPSYYRQYRQDASQEAEGMLRGSAGVRVPANVFLYQFADMPHVVFGMLPITDAEAFSTFIRRQESWDYEAGTMPRRLASSRMLALHTEDAVAFALFPGSGGQLTETIESCLGDMLQKKQLVPLSESRFAALKKQRGHINVMGDRSLWVEFRQGAIAFSVGAAWDDTLSWEAPAGDTGILVVPASYWSQAGWDTWQPRNSGVLSRDSLKNHIHGTITVQWSGTATQTDTVITYEYDEDFNPVETRTAVGRTVPALYGTVFGDTRGLVGYLAGQAILDTVSGQISREIFPPFSVYVDGTDATRLLVSSVAIEEKQAAPPASPGHEDSLRLYLNIADVVDQAVFPQAVADLLAPFSAVALRGGDPVAGTVIRGKLIMKEGSIQSLMQLYPFLERGLPEE